MLRQIGAALNANGSLRVHTEGVISVDHETQKESEDERQRERRPAARPRQRTARRQGAPGGPWSSSPASRVGSDLQQAYESQLRSAGEAYPSLATFPDKDGLWLLVKSSILPSLTREATFLVALPYRNGAGPRAWGFWTATDRSPRWIGPRHTNFHDGTICAFAPTDGAWAEGDDLRTLLDLYTVWAARQLFLEVFGLWPGKQYALIGSPLALQVHYRLSECRDDELCGCGSETLRYADCCKPGDLKWNRLQLIEHFMQAIPGGFASRKPPVQVLDYIDGRASPPLMAEVHMLVPAS